MTNARASSSKLRHAHDAGPETPPFEQALSTLKRETSPEVSAASFDAFGRDARAFAVNMYRKLAPAPGNLFSAAARFTSSRAPT